MGVNPTEREKIAQEIYERQQHLLDRTDNKANFLLTVLSIIAATVGVLLQTALGKSEDASFIAIFFISVFIFFIIGFFVLFELLEVLGPHTVNPSAKPENYKPTLSEAIKSLFKRNSDNENGSDTFTYYTSIFKLKEETYRKQISEKSREAMINENISQAYMLAKILNYKMVFLKKAEMLLRIMFILLIVIVVILFIMHGLL